MNITEASRPTYRGCAVTVTSHSHSAFTIFIWWYQIETKQRQIIYRSNRVETLADRNKSEVWLPNTRL